METATKVGLSTGSPAGFSLEIGEKPPALRTHRYRFFASIPPAVKAGAF